TLCVGDEGFYCRLRTGLLGLSHSLVPYLGAPVFELVAVDGSDDGVFNAHSFDCLGNALRLICIVFGGTSRGDSAECAASRTNISLDHERRRPRSPAFTLVRAIAAVANGVQLVLVQQPPHLGILRANSKFNPKPVGFLSAWLVVYHRKLDHSCLL